MIKVGDLVVFHRFKPTTAPAPVEDLERGIVTRMEPTESGVKVWATWMQQRKEMFGTLQKRSGNLYITIQGNIWEVVENPDANTDAG